VRRTRRGIVTSIVSTIDIDGLHLQRAKRLKEDGVAGGLQHLYKNRNLVERFFSRIKQFRRIATHYDKLAARFASFVAIVAAVIWLA